MPEFIRSPYVADQRTMLDLMRLASRERSQADVQKAAVRAQGLLNIGQLIAGTLASIRQDREQQGADALAMRKQQDEAAFRQRDQELREADLLARAQDRDDATAARADAAREKASADAYKRGGEVAEEVGYGPMSELQLDSVMQGPAAGRARYVFGPGTADGPELQPTQAQQRGIHTERAIQEMGGQIGPNGQVIMPPKPERDPNPTEASLAMLAAKGDKMAAQALQTLQRMRREGQAPRQPIWVVGPDGQFQDLAGVAPPGSKPASSREQGRAVTSGDAGRIADFDTALDDLDTLSGTIQGVAGSTGTRAQIGAALPNWVTEWTGRGASAKSKQAVIDRVKQVIGKALEGGVLRKEDEIKYAKILPTIGDVPEVVKTKLEGLQQAIHQRRQTTLDALSDAGYDVGRFQQRKRSGPAQDDPVDALIKKYGGGD